MIKEDGNKTRTFYEERFDEANNIIDDEGIITFQDWVHLQWAAQNRDDDRMMYGAWYDTIIREETRVLLGKTTTIIFKTDKKTDWKFKSGITEKKFIFDWVARK